MTPEQIMQQLNARLLATAREYGSDSSDYNKGRYDEATLVYELFEEIFNGTKETPAGFEIKPVLEGRE